MARVLARDIAAVCPPDPAVTHVMVWAEYGYSANVSPSDFLAGTTVFAHSRNGAGLSPEHGWPLRFVCPPLYAWKSAKRVRAIEYLVGDRRGFWEIAATTIWEGRRRSSATPTRNDLETVRRCRRRQLQSAPSALETSTVEGGWGGGCG